MKTLTEPKYQFILETAIENLHEESKNWISEVDHWSDEFKFFQHLLEEYISKIKDEDAVKQIDNFQNKITYYRDEALPQLRSDVKDHEKILNGIMENMISEERTYRDGHKKLSERLDSFEDSIKDFKQELFLFVEKYSGDRSS